MTAPMGSPPASSASGSRSPWGAQSAWGGNQRKPKKTPQDPNASATQAPAEGGPQTFAQMQAQGQARPAPMTPPAAPTPAASPTQPAQPTGLAAQVQSAFANRIAPPTAPSDGGGGGIPVPPTIPQAPTPPTGGTSGTTGTGNLSAAYPSVQYDPAHIAAPAISGDLTSSVQAALANPSRYAQPAMEAARASGLAQLKQSFGAQQKQLDEEMARRGIGASSIAGGYQGDLSGQQATAEAGLESNLLQNQAQTYSQDLAAALGAGQNLYGSQAAQNLGAAQLGTQASLGAGSLDLGGKQLTQQGSQFGQSLAQTGDLARMSDTTANRGLDIQNQSNNNQLNMQVAALLAAMGYPSASAGSGTAPVLPASGASGGSGGGTGGTGGTPSIPSSGGGGSTPPGGVGAPTGGDPVSGGSKFDPNTTVADIDKQPSQPVGLAAQTAAALGAGNAGAPNVPGAGTPNAPHGPMGPSGQQQGPDAPANFGVNNPSADSASALRALESTTGVSADKFGLTPASTPQEIDTIRGLMSAIGNRQPSAIEAGKTSTNPFVQRTAWSYALGYGAQGLPAQVAAQLGLKG